MNSNHVLSKQTLYAFKYRTSKRRTTSTIIGGHSALSIHKTSNSIGSSITCQESELAKIKIEIKERLKEQKKREEILSSMMQSDNEPVNTELYTETTRKSELKTSESAIESSYSFCFKKIFSRCFWN